MKTTELKNGQVVEEFENLKEAKQMILDGYINNMEYLSEEDCLYIKYKDGSCYIISCGVEVEGTFKKTNIETVIIDNGMTYQVYGKYQLVKTDEEDNDTDCCWLVDEVDDATRKNN